MPIPNTLNHSGVMIWAFLKEAPVPSMEVWGFPCVLGSFSRALVVRVSVAWRLCRGTLKLMHTRPRTLYSFTKT